MMVKRFEDVTVIGSFISCLILTKESFATAGMWLQCCDLAVCFLLQYNLQLDQSHNKWFRLHKDGLWCALMVPCILTVFYKHDILLVQLLVCVTLLTYVISRRDQLTKSPLCNGTAIMYLLGRVTVSCYSDIAAVDIPTVISVVQLVFMLMLVPFMFQRSFTFGEMSLLCQLHVLYCHTIFTQNLSGIQHMATVMFVGVHLTVLILCISTKYHLAAIGTWLILVLTGVVYCLLVVHLHFQGRKLTQLVADVSELFLSRVSIYLLSWWSLLTLSSILLVCWHGNRSQIPLDINKKSCDLSHESALFDPLISKGGTERDDNSDQYKQLGSPECWKSEQNMNNGQTHANNSSDSPRTMSDSPRTVSDSPRTRNSIGKSSSHKLHFKIDKKSTNKSDMDIDNNTTEPLKVKCRLHDGLILTNRSYVSTRTRKYFHLMMLLVYIPGLMYHQDLLFVASCLATCLLVLLEAARYSELSPVGSILDQYLFVFLDSQDKGDLILTHIYLILGCSLPLWVHHSFTGTSLHMSVFAGLVSVGVGDSAASIVGSKFGVHKWPDSQKSIEGTLASVVSQLITLVGLHYTGEIETALTTTTILLVILNSCLEACTLQIDNLVLPVFTFMTFLLVQV